MTFQMTLITSKKMPLYTRHNMVHVAAFWANVILYFVAARSLAFLRNAAHV